MSSTAIDVTNADFETKAVKASGPVLAVFRAEWSSACKALDPILVDVAKQYADRLTVARLDIDQSPRTPPKYNVTAIPPCTCSRTGRSSPPGSDRPPRTTWST
ncbi:thioredoxin family protein [Kitasatospora griseola]|uniref:thioredoxin family protein n=1 Tax=Kitasatospora griseola TaxID=2064 RepID=UPI0037F98794